MAAGPQSLSDIVVPDVFAQYVLIETAVKSRLIQSGAAQTNPVLTSFLSGGGLTGNLPSWRDVDTGVTERTATDAEHFSLTSRGATAANAIGPAINRDPVPQKPVAQKEIFIRLTRNQSWEGQDILADLAGDDPLRALVGRVGTYWAHRLQAAFVSSMRGVIADNVANDSNDYVNTVGRTSGTVTAANKFSAGAIIDTSLTMGDSLEDTSIIMVHSVTYGAMLKADLIAFVKASDPSNAMIPTYLGRQVIVDDGMPTSGTGAVRIFDTWLLGPGVIQLGLGNPKVPFEVDRLPGAGNGGGEEVMYSRQQWVLHPRGHAYTGATTAEGGPSNATLQAAASWDRIFGERKQIQIAVLKHNN